MTQRLVYPLVTLALGLAAGYLIAPPHRNWEAHWTPDLANPGGEIYLGHFESADVCAKTARELLSLQKTGFVNCGFKCRGEAAVAGRECRENVKHQP